MKTLKNLFLIAAVLVAISCNKRKNTAISGVYVADSKNEFTILSDTLIIEAYNLSAGIYHIEKRSGYHLIREGKTLPKRFAQKAWTATFDQEKQLLSESGFGKQIFLNTDAGTLLFGGTYRKIK